MRHHCCCPQHLGDRISPPTEELHLYRPRQQLLRSTPRRRFKAIPGEASGEPRALGHTPNPNCLNRVFSREKAGLRTGCGLRSQVIDVLNWAQSGSKVAVPALKTKQLLTRLSSGFAGRVPHVSRVSRHGNHEKVPFPYPLVTDFFQAMVLHHPMPCYPCLEHRETWGTRPLRKGVGKCTRTSMN